MEMLTMHEIRSAGRPATPEKWEKPRGQNRAAGGRGRGEGMFPGPRPRPKPQGGKESQPAGGSEAEEIARLKAEVEKLKAEAKAFGHKAEEERVKLVMETSLSKAEVMKLKTRIEQVESRNKVLEEGAWNMREEVAQARAEVDRLRAGRPRRRTPEEIELRRLRSEVEVERAINRFLRAPATRPTQPPTEPEEP
jgi:hypothetical protein